MACHRQATIFLLTYFLLTACLCSQTPRSRRQKRGLMKMMMHIMWDPVRLIRYWYAYDVTREIAKSWRKIIPTVLLLPITQHMPHSYGIAKYVHPTVGVRDYNKSKIKFKYPNIPVGSYQESAGNVKPVAISPSLLHEILPSGYASDPHQAAHQYYTSSRETESDTQYKHKKVPHVIVGHDPYADDKENNNQYSIAHYFVGDGTSREEIPISAKDMFFVGQADHSAEEDISSSSSQSVIRTNYKKRPHNFPSGTRQKSHIHYVSQLGKHEAIIKDESGQESSPVLHLGQEFHIVLHPIPINDFNPDSLKPPSDGQPIQFVPVQPQSNNSHSSSFGPSPILFKAILQNNVVSDDSHEEHAIDNSAKTDSNILKFHLNDSDSSIDEEKLNASSEDIKSRVTWVPQKNANLSRRTDKKDSDLQADGTIKRTVSVHRNSPYKYISGKDGSTRFALNRHSINMDQLREDLKHGTPVLIPFNKNTYSSEVPSSAEDKNPIVFPQRSDQHLDDDHTKNEHNSRAKFVTVPLVNDSSGMNFSSEQSDENNSTQRLVLFLKKTKLS